MILQLQYYRFLIKMYTIPHHDRGYLYVVLVFQSSRDPLHILPGSSIDTCATSSACAYDIGKMEFEEDLDMQEEEEEENVVIKEEEGEVIHIKEEEDVGIKEEVSLEDTV